MYRKAVLMLIKKEEKFLLAIPSKADTYHIPGGGVEENETYLEAFFREANEELGLNVEDFLKVHVTEFYNNYDWPKQLIEENGFIGQEKRIIVGEIKKESKIDLTITNELRKYEFFDYEEMLNKIIYSNLVTILKKMRKQKLI
jgi:8-oxo-dGTP pyrophosphatase MutT (NUDIX family)